MKDISINDSKSMLYIFLVIAIAISIFKSNSKPFAIFRKLSSCSHGDNNMVLSNILV